MTTPNWHKTTGRIWIVFTFVTLALHAEICFQARGVTKLKQRIAQLQDELPKPVDLSGYVKRTELMPSAFKGRK